MFPGVTNKNFLSKVGLKTWDDYHSLRHKILSKKREASGFTKELKTSIKERAAYRCEICKKTHVSLVVHHKKEFCKGGTNEPENLMAVCHSCHKKIHRHLCLRKKD
jgi:5-methylcytosine-specific restriction endonuclease McrA